MKPTIPLMLSALIFMATPTLAQDYPGPVMLPAGQTMISISATERIQVPQDTLIATLRVEKTGSDPRSVQDAVNTVMKAATDKAKAVSSVKVSTGGYYVYEETPPHRPVPAGQTAPAPTKKTWRANQTLELKSTASDDLLKLTGELQDMGMLINGLNYTLSVEKTESIKDNLMEAALVKLKTRAERAAKALGKTQTDLVDVNVDSSNSMSPPYPVMRAMAMSSDSMEKMATPTAEAGETEITLTVSARALLKP